VTEATVRDLDCPVMLSGVLEGGLLAMLVHATAARHVLEIGTFSGYSALAMAAALPAGGRITTCELDERHAAAARRHFAAGEAGRLIDLRVGPAAETIAGLPGPFDLVFIDADKSSYVAYYEAVLPKLSPQGLIVVDNTLWGGAVADPADESETTTTIRAFNDHVAADPRTLQVVLPVGDGMTLIRPAP
jgi:caffeoyl-CoA O-methyltransferase